MTREERARAALAAVIDTAGRRTYAQLVRLSVNKWDGFGGSEVIAAMLSFADAEAAAMRERAAGVADAHVAMGYMSGRERDYCHGHGDEIAELIRALPTTEVGK